MKKQVLPPEIVEAKILDPLVHIVEQRRDYTDEERLFFLHTITESMTFIAEKELELKLFAADIKKQKEEQEAIMYDAADKARAGYEMTSIPCSVSYKGDIATYVDKATKKVVKTEKITPEEQTRLNNQHVIDAEVIIRESTAHEDDAEEKE